MTYDEINDLIDSSDEIVENPRKTWVCMSENGVYPQL
jgi:hypothetical protein